MRNKTLLCTSLLTLCLLGFAVGSALAQTSQVLYNGSNFVQPTVFDPTSPGPPRSTSIAASSIICEDIRIPFSQMNHSEDDQIVVTRFTLKQYVLTTGTPPSDINHGWQAWYYLFDAFGGPPATFYPSVTSARQIDYQNQFSFASPVGYALRDYTWNGNAIVQPGLNAAGGYAVIFFGWSAQGRGGSGFIPSPMGLAYANGPDSAYDYSHYYVANNGSGGDGWYAAPRLMPFAIKIEGYSRLTRPPTIAFLDPIGAEAGSGPVTLTVSGGNFRPGSTVLWNGSPLVTTFVKSNQLKATIPASELTVPRNVLVTVRNPPGTTSGATSDPKGFVVSGIAHDLYVDRANSGTEDGSVTHPFRTLTAALNAANPSVAVTIHVRAGNYTENPNITKNVEIVTWNNTGVAQIGTP